YCFLLEGSITAGMSVKTYLLNLISRGGQYARNRGSVCSKISSVAACFAAQRSLNPHPWLLLPP
ncbi:hypothetical protein, partial [Petrimonas sp.]|uniref:hypothetical protein n=1 Tax=Petrimonas sp. TaxID=2023866 RepID=UPI003F5123AA